MQKEMTAVINRDGDVYVAFCPELDIASQGASIESARDNLREALELFFESASADEIRTTPRSTLSGPCSTYRAQR
jgi:predicted RNase H-like HicB family nuclease